MTCRPALEAGPPLPLVQPGWPFGALWPRWHAVILADPPWKYRLYSAKGEKRSPQRHYPCMDLGAIMALPVAQLAQGKGCLLALWATAPMLPQALETMAAWGFRYVTHLVWEKTTADGATAMGLGYVVRNAHELLLIGTRGKVKWGPERRRLLSVFHARRSRHSAKPATQYELLGKLVTEGERCELFARASHPGWHGCGDQLPEAGHG